MATREQDNALSELADRHASLRCRPLKCGALRVTALDASGREGREYTLDEDGREVYADDSAYYEDIANPPWDRNGA